MPGTVNHVKNSQLGNSQSQVVNLVVVFKVGTISSYISIPTD